MKKPKNKTVLRLWFINKKIIKFFLIVLSMIIFLFIATKLFLKLKKYIKNAFLSKDIELKVDSIYSDKLKLSILNFVNLNLDKNLILNEGIDDFCANLKNNFGVIKDIEWNFGLHNSINLLIKGTKPVCKVNNKFVLGDNKKFFDLDYFCDFDNENLKNAYFAKNLLNKKNIDDVIKFFLDFNFNFLTNYELNYLKPSCIAFITNQDDWGKKDFFIIDKDFKCDEQEFFWAELINNHIKNNSRWKRGYCFDLRFKNRIYAKPTGRSGLEFAKNMGRE